MFDAFAKVVSQADARGEYVSAAQLDALSTMVAESNKRLDVVNRLSGSSSAIVASAARSLFAAQPGLITPGGNAYTNRRMAACLRDMEIILRYVSYAMLAGDASILEDRCLNGLKQTYQALGVPSASMSLSIQNMKSVALDIVRDTDGITPGDCSSLVAELSIYFDKAARAVA